MIERWYLNPFVWLTANGACLAWSMWNGWPLPIALNGVAVGMWLYDAISREGRA